MACNLLFIDLGKKENLKTSLETFGNPYLKAWLLCGLNSLFGIKCSSVFMSTEIMTKFVH